MGRGEWIRNSKFGQNDHCTIESGSEPKNMSVPPKSASLAGDGEVVYIALSCLKWTLCYIGRPIRPSCPQLSNAMPELSCSHESYSLDMMIIMLCYAMLLLFIF